MGNALRQLSACLCDAIKQQAHEAAAGYGGGDHHAGYGASSEAGFAAFARDILHFDATGEVPEGLASFVQATRATQVIWYAYKKLLSAWKGSQPPPRNAAEATQLITQSLQTRRKSDLQGLLRFYGLSHPVVGPTPSNPSIQALYPTWPKGVQYEFTTLPVEGHSVADGDTITVFVDVSKDDREERAVPRSVFNAVEKRRRARENRDYKKADMLQQQIFDAGYKVFDGRGSEVLTHKYRIRLRGVDAPESSMPHGPESKAMLIKLVEGQQLRVYVYTADQYGRLVADVHTSHGFLQEQLLKRGCVWHYSQYDHRPELSEWEQEARRARVGLWHFPNPVKPWEYRKNAR
ncbi:hypothetical protein SELMODRAFT_168869 [Selaginella moellendorffii]|uniref:TNase-like domain-containing protein n=1 Tax=Selaginella moellendorffii TaxID=88036 RepID=D8R7X9_SELML|nr:hypothetical protein SELMODRAFT_168869 [Selaginella moellendorffii]